MKKQICEVSTIITNVIQWPRRIKRNEIKAPHRYAVQVSDTTMMTNAASSLVQ